MNEYNEPNNEAIDEFMEMIKLSNPAMNFKGYGNILKVLINLYEYTEGSIFLDYISKLDCLLQHLYDDLKRKYKMHDVYVKISNKED